ncbi:unnamed protein product [Adineta steineri]|uniref:Protein kinase domain-containing protein n=1 Tax=Adineta steineri TaxID=433720 RepID=A0A814AMR9_9BILA|nr:unnamed protein product [Adineta steineri]CAF3671994.1 unnamed protein product [Adineta steineri]
MKYIGTPRYMSPELLARTIRCIEISLLKCDADALGIIFLEKLNLFQIKTNDKIIDIDVNNCIYPFGEQLKK